jgi:hypothetical protein
LGGRGWNATKDGGIQEAVLDGEERRYKLSRVLSPPYFPLVLDGADLEQTSRLDKQENRREKKNSLPSAALRDTLLSAQRKYRSSWLLRRPVFSKQTTLKRRDIPPYTHCLYYTFLRLQITVVTIRTTCSNFVFHFVEWSEAEPTWYVGH